MSRKYNSYTYEEYLRAMRMIKELGVAETSRRTGYPKPTLYRWKNGKQIPPLARWVPKLSNELAYIIGVLHGDGSLYINEYNYRIGLGVKDYEFAETFSKNMARLLNKKVVKPYWNKANNEWVVVYSSKAFYTWYKQQSLESLKQFIEYSKETVASFLRGLYDSEGNYYMYKRIYNQIRLSNNDIELLKYVQYLLKKYFNIITTEPHINVKAGTEHKIRDEKMFKTKHDNYYIAICRKRLVQRFLNEIGFSITEKQLGLPRRK